MTLLSQDTPSFFYKKRSKRVTSRDFGFSDIFCTVVSYFYRRSVDSRFLTKLANLGNSKAFFGHSGVKKRLFDEF